MAMNPMQKKARVSFLLGMFLTLIITGLVIVFLILELGKMKKEQSEIITRQVYMITQNVESGGKLLGSLQKKEVDSTVAPANAITDINYIDYITDAATSKIALGVGTILTTDMINKEGQAFTADVRLQEYNMLVLPTKLEAGQYVDIRLRLPSGEDYIVISKKYVEQTSSDTIWIKVAEEEILTMSNAIVEAYIMEGSVLYATVYADAGIQTEAIPTYVVKSSVMNLMDADSNIVNAAKTALYERYTNLARAQRDNIINPTVSNVGDNALSNVQSNVEQEIQKRQNARKQYVDSLGK